ncbi:hypothetical protein BpHYR1_039317 [Brachionus plicatilis]|uniref:Uncharacterized protein n=1 Tax=Brachionus plicatilis TaxID=10195 RepID=A0A3M7QQI5_BRAPC|nr:hypothetical protein BpHYR1_039317 [Brachionus plicatilis]
MSAKTLQTFYRTKLSLLLHPNNIIRKKLCYRWTKVNFEMKNKNHPGLGLFLKKNPVLLIRFVTKLKISQLTSNMNVDEKFEFCKKKFFKKKRFYTKNS